MVSKNETGRRAFSPLPTWGLLAITKYVVMATKVITPL